MARADFPFGSVSQQFIALLPVESARLIVRASTREDAAALMRMDRSEHVQRFLGGVKNSTEEERKRFFEREIEKFKAGKCGSLTLVLKATGAPIGFLKFSIHDDNNNAELSFILDHDHWRQGYCTEICARLLEVGFNQLGLNRIYADSIEGNDSSMKVLERLGLRMEGRLRQQAYDRPSGRYKDLILWGIVREDYGREN